MAGSVKTNLRYSSTDQLQSTKISLSFFIAAIICFSMILRQFFYATILMQLSGSALAQSASQEKKHADSSVSPDSDRDFEQIFFKLKAASRTKKYHENRNVSSSSTNQSAINAERKIYTTKGRAPADVKFSEIFSTWRKRSTLKGSASRKLESNSKNGDIPARKIPYISSDFGLRRDPVTHKNRMHQGLDIPGPLGTEIYATANGVVKEAKWLGSYGLFVEIEHTKGVRTRYAHLSRINVIPGQKVRRKDIIGSMGSTGRSTGNHLHYEVYIDGVAVDPKPLIISAY